MEGISMDLVKLFRLRREEDKKSPPNGKFNSGQRTAEYLPMQLLLHRL